MSSLEHLGPYRVGEPIGRGGMGSVFKAIHEKTGDEVAVKVIAASVSDDMRFRRRFSAEIETLKKLKHPNIVTLIGYGEQEGKLFYSMELVEGESLQQRLKREKRLAWPFVLDMAIEICNALKHAHNFGVIHRDLKPANLLIATDGTPKLVDFGIAKLFGNSDETAAGSVLGTADFMAPEQACDGPISPRTDLYALGNVLYACFTGRPPFAGRTMTRVIEALQRETPVSLELVASDLPIEIAQLVHDLLEKIPEDRPPTALAVMNRMKAIRAGLMRKAENEGAGKAVVAKPDLTGKLGTSSATNRPSSTDTPTVVADDEVVRRTVIPRHDLTIDSAAESAASRSANTLRSGEARSSELHSVELRSSELRSSELALTGESLKSGAKPASGALTKASVGDQRADSRVRESQPTHFNTIQEKERRRGIWESDGIEATSSRLPQVLSVGAMVSVLVGAAILFIWSMQRPTADSLYSAIIAAQEQDDSAAVVNQLDQFKRLYPDDTRLAEFDSYLDDRDSTRIVRRLRVASVREGGDEHLEPHQQSFLEAMRHIEVDPGKSQVMLNQWLAVYDPPAPSPRSLQSLELQSIARAARQELQRLATKPISPVDLRATELIQRIEWASKTLSKADYRKMLEGIISLYGGRSWAVPAMEIATKQLEELSGQPESAAIKPEK